MSIHLYSFSDLPLASIGEWQKFIDAADFPLWLSTEHELDKNGGSLVAQLHGKQISFEYRFENAKELMDLYNDINFGHDWKYLLVLPWIHGFDGLDAAWMAATSYAHATAALFLTRKKERSSILRKHSKSCTIWTALRQKRRPRRNKLSGGFQPNRKAKNPRSTPSRDLCNSSMARLSSA